MFTALQLYSSFIFLDYMIDQKGHAIAAQLFYMSVCLGAYPVIPDLCSNALFSSESDPFQLYYNRFLVILK